MNTLYAWTFSTQKNRSQLWYVVAFSVALGLTVWGIFTGLYLMSFVIILLTGLYFFIENNSSDEVTVQVGELGMKIGEIFYDYKKIAGYSFVYADEHPVILRLYLTSGPLKMMDIKIDQEVTQNLRPILPEFIEEKEDQKLRFTDKLIRFLDL